MRIKGGDQSKCYCLSNVKLMTSISDGLEMSKHKMYIGSTSVSSTKSCNLFISGEVNDLIEGLQEVENYSAVVDKPTQNLASKAIEKNTHLNRHNHDNDLTSISILMIGYAEVQAYPEPFFH